MGAFSLIVVINLLNRNGKYKEPVQEGSPGQEDEAEQASAPVGPHEDQQHYQVQCQEATLEKDQDKDLRVSLSLPILRSTHFDEHFTASYYKPIIRRTKPTWILG